MKFIGILLLIIIWFALTSLGLANSLFIPTPQETVMKIIDLFSELAFYQDLYMTLYRIIIGLFLSTVLGVSLGLVLGKYKKAYEASEFLLDFLRSIPATALFPLALLIFGIGESAKIGIVVYSCTLVLALQTYYGVIGASKIRRKFFETISTSEWFIFKNFLLWEALPYIFSGLRIIASLSLILVIVTEMFIGTELGLGKRLIDAQSTYRVSELYATIFIVGLIGYLINKAIIFFEKRVVHWR